MIDISLQYEEHIASISKLKHNGISLFMFLRNVGMCVPDYTAEHPQKQNRIFSS